MDPVLLAIDVGTSACKVTAFELDGRVLFASSREYELSTPAPGYVEQDPNQWWEQIVNALREVMNAVGKRNVASIGVTGQSWSAVPVDAEGKVLANTPIWMDTRAEDVCREVLEDCDHDEIVAVSGNRFSPSYSTPKVLWFKRHLPVVYEQTQWFLQSNSFVVYRLTGKVSGDLSQGYGLHFVDVRTGEFNHDLAAKLGVDLAKFPELVPCHEVVGHVTEEVADQTGLPAGTPVVAGGLDAACGALGAGVHRVGQTQEQGGQAGGLSVVCAEAQIDPRLILSQHVVPGVWLLQGGTAAGGAALRWAREAVGGGAQSFADIDTEAAKVEPGSDGVTFLPYLAGERSPIWDPNAVGLFYGLRLSTTQAHLYRSVMEGVTFALLDNVDVVRATGADLGEVFAIGGAASSDFWTQMKADVLQHPVYVPDANAATSLGAAILAGVGVGIYSSFADAVKKTVRVKKAFEPTTDAQVIKKYSEAYETYRLLYPALSGVMGKCAEKGSHNGE